MTGRGYSTMIPTHGLNHLAQAANANVCASFHLGNMVKWKTPRDSNNGGLACDSFKTFGGEMKKKQKLPEILIKAIIIHQAMPEARRPFCFKSDVVFQESSQLFLV